MYIFLYKVNGNRCGFNRSIGPTALNIVFCVTVFVEYIVPVILISFSYVRILLVLRHKLDIANANQQDGVFSKAKRNVIMTMLIAGSVFFICWTPVEMFRLLFAIGVLTASTPSLDFLYQTFITLVMCNMSVNPVVYCFKYEHFRTQLTQLVRSRFGRNRVRPGEESTDAPSLSINTTRQTETRPL